MRSAWFSVGTLATCLRHSRSTMRSASSLRFKHSLSLDLRVASPVIPARSAVQRCMRVGTNSALAMLCRPIPSIPPSNRRTPLRCAPVLHKALVSIFIRATVPETTYRDVTQDQYGGNSSQKMNNFVFIAPQATGTVQLCYASACLSHSAKAAHSQRSRVPVRQHK